MTGVLAIWNDCAPEGEEHYERWYKSEHMQERVGVPGFRFGRRYERAGDADRRFFTYYEVENAGVLSSPAYVTRLENPTPWTTESMKYFRNMSRTVCDIKCSVGDLIGSHAVVLRADQSMSPTPGAGQVMQRLANEAGVARVQLWTAAAQQTPSETREMKSRAKDRHITGAFVVECLRSSDAARVERMLRTKPPAEIGIKGAHALGVYALLAIYAKR
jgi:hypothetical protein